MLKKKYSDMTSYYASICVTYVKKINGKFVFSPANASLPYNPIESEQKMITQCITPNLVKDSLVSASQITFEVTDVNNLTCVY